MTDTSVRDARWLPWLREQVLLGADLSAAVAALRKVGVAEHEIMGGLETVRPRGDALATGMLQLPPLIRRAPVNLRRVDTAKADLYLYDDFLSAQECEALIALIGPHLRPSPLAGDAYDSQFRTSQTCLLAHLQSPIGLGLDERICRILGIRAEYGEGIQVQRYDVGQQFKTHLDGFPPGTPEYQKFAGMRGNRTWTFMVYLNQDMEGGGTRFTELDCTVQPRTGMALLWNNLHADGSLNLAMRHSGEPVLRGFKVIITKWFRVHGDGPLFYE
jgi:prolyl 4-hydroxylase